MASAEVREAFLRQFGAEPELIAVAPGRINLIGEHTDYNDGFVFPVAIDRETWLAVSIADNRTTLHSEQAGTGAPFDVASVEPGQVRGWARYPAGMGWAMRRFTGRVSNLRGVVSSNVPMGAGVSSSAALEMAFGVAWRALDGLQISRLDVVRQGQLCENKFVGVNSGIMDQMASASGKEGYAMFLDTRSLDIEYAPIPQGLSIALCDTGKPRSLTASAYNERRSQCEAAAAVLGVDTLRDADMARLESHESSIPETVYRRARHVITENERAVRFKTALGRSDLDDIGLLMRASHESLRDDYEVSCRELDLMAEAAWASPGCIGARMTGAGFGGACVALVQTELFGLFAKHVVEKYDNSSGLCGAAMGCQAVDGARVTFGP